MDLKFELIWSSPKEDHILVSKDDLSVTVIIYYEALSTQIIQLDKEIFELSSDELKKVLESSREMRKKLSEPI
jgi:hypothetical protein